jgi:hypothetical protein
MIEDLSNSVGLVSLPHDMNSGQRTCAERRGTGWMISMLVLVSTIASGLFDLAITKNEAI